jgi:F-type H+-transporting ATPase subunit b
MLIDWFTVGAQTLNFIILVWLMKRFLYKPILHAIDAREKKIAGQLAHADELSKQASQAKDSFESKDLELDQQREQLMIEATEAANLERDRLLQESRKIANDLQTKQREALQKEMQELHQSVRKAMQRELFSIAKKALHDLAEVEIEAQMVAVFIKQLGAIDDKQMKAMRAALGSTELQVLSSSKLSADQQSAIQQSLAELLGNDVELQFNQAPDMIGGLELTTGDYKIGWNIAAYLQDLQASLSKPIDAHIKVAAPPASSNNTATTETEPEPEQRPTNNTQ